MCRTAGILGYQCEGREKNSKRGSLCNKGGELQSFVITNIREVSGVWPISGLQKAKEII